jgi:uncharacterized protein (TIGR02265 family)
VPAPAARTIDLDQGRALLALDERLKATPASAEVRGFLFKMTSDAVASQGRAATEMQRRLAPPQGMRLFFRTYSAREYLEDVAAAAIVLAPSDPASALRSIWARTTGYAPLFDVRRFLGLLGADVMSVVRWLEGHRHFFANYGRWRMERLGERYFVMHYFDECIWIDSAHRGGMEGLLGACGVDGTVEPDLDTPFSGRLHVRWRAR